MQTPGPPDSSPTPEAPPPASAPLPRAAVAAIAGAFVITIAVTAWVLGVAPHRAPAPLASGGATGAPSPPDEDDVARALRLARIDPSQKNTWVDSIPALDLGGLSAGQRAKFVRFANAERCTCGCGFTLAACRQFDSSCETSGPRVEALLDSVRRGWVGSTAGLRTPPTR